MKTNVVLLCLLLVQSVAFLFGSDDNLERSQLTTLSQQLSPKASLPYGASGADLQRWLDQINIKREEGASALGSRDLSAQCRLKVCETQ